MNWKTLQSQLAANGYIATDELVMALHLSRTLARPILLEGAAGVGKTEVAKMLSQINSCALIRLQCYEGLDAHTAIYEWNYQRQLLSIRAMTDPALNATGNNAAGNAADSRKLESVEEELFSDRFLLKRPLLQAITQKTAPVLLIDEIDRADEEFEAYLLELLSDFQVTIPELGTIEATTRPQVVLTSNGSRDLSDALRRRCLYTYVDYPDSATELAILNTRLPEIDSKLAEQVTGFVQALRKEELEKNPGIAEMLDWAGALYGLGVNDLSDDPTVLQATLVCLLKTQADMSAVPTEVAQRIAGSVG